MAKNEIITHGNDDKLIVVDLEATCSQDHTVSRSDMEIIEIGAAIVGLNNFEILDRFQLYIRPVVTPRLTDFCTELTGISQATVDEAHIFGTAIHDYINWLKSHKNIVAWSSWGNYDKGQFELDYKRHGISDVHEGLPHFNLKTLFAKATEKRRMGLGRAIKSVDAEFQGRAHSGLDDAVNMSRLFTLAPEFGRLMRDKIYKTND